MPNFLEFLFPKEKFESLPPMRPPSWPALHQCPSLQSRGMAIGLGANDGWDLFDLNENHPTMFMNAILRCPCCEWNAPKA